MFNDDVQGTGAVILGGFIGAVIASGTAAKDHRAIFLGAGSAGTGVAKQLVEYFIKEGLTEDEARKKFWFVDSNVSYPLFMHYRARKTDKRPGFGYCRSW